MECLESTGAPGPDPMCLIRPNVVSVQNGALPSRSEHPELSKTERPETLLLTALEGEFEKLKKDMNNPLHRPVPIKSNPPPPFLNQLLSPNLPSRDAAAHVGRLQIACHKARGVRVLLRSRGLIQREALT